MILYRLTFASGKVYIGQTIRNMNTRYHQHKNEAAYGSMLAVHCAWRKHGAPVVDVLGVYEDRETLNEAEIAAIAEMGSLWPNGYNVALGGCDGSPKSPIVRAKMSESSKGKSHSDETKAKIAEASRKHWEDPEYRAKVEAGVAASFTPERRARIAEISKRVHTGAKHSEETKQKIRNRVISDETRAKMSAAAKGKPKAPRSLETRMKLSAAVKASHDGKARGPAISASLKKMYQEMTPEQRQAFSDVRKRAWQTRRAKAAE